MAAAQAGPTDLLSVDVEGWKLAVPEVGVHYAQFDSKLPASLRIAVDSLEANLVIICRTGLGSA